MNEILKKPSAYLPLVMSATALIFLLGHLAIFGISDSQTHDESAAARLFQLLVVGQTPIIAYFALRWLPKKAKEVLWTIVLQIISALIPLTIVYYLEL